MIFNFGKSTFLGVDFGTSSVKMVELTVKEKNPVLVNYAEVPLEHLKKKGGPDTPEYEEAAILYLRALIERLKPKSKDAYAAIPAFSGLITLIEMPELEEKDMEQAIKFEAHKYIPSALEDVNLSWEIVGYREKQGEKQAVMEVLLVAALKKDVDRYRKYLEAAGLHMKHLELETFSLVRAVIKNKTGVFLQIDIGARATNLVLVHDGWVKVSRNIDVGGNDITRTLTEVLEITPERADALKKSDKDFLNDPVSAVLFPTLQVVVSEAKRIVTLYKEKHPEIELSGIVLSGGSAHFTGLTQYMGGIFAIPVTIGDPWEGIDRGGSAGSEKDGAFSVALGLALAGIESHSPQKRMGKKSLTLKEFLNKKL